MKILVPDFRKGVKVAIESAEDLWYLSHIIEAGDSVSGRTERKIKLGGEGENAKISKKRIFLKVAVEKVEFHRYSDVLRVSGKVVSESEDVPRGSYHTFDLTEGEAVTIEKGEWLKYQKDRLFEAAKEDAGSMMAVILERDEAEFFLIKRYGHEKILSLSGDVPKKGLDERKESTFFQDVIKKMEEYLERYNLHKIILASPAFWKEDLLKHVRSDRLRSKIVTATCSSGNNAINEVLTRPEVAHILKEDKASQELKAVDELLSEIGKERNAAYGKGEAASSAKAGAVLRLLITDGLIHKARDDGTYSRLDSIMRDVDKKGGEIRIISSESDAGKKLDGLGGIGAILRYKVSY